MNLREFVAHMNSGDGFGYLIDPAGGLHPVDLRVYCRLTIAELDGYEFRPTRIGAEALATERRRRVEARS